MSEMARCDFYDCGVLWHLLFVCVCDDLALAGQALYHLSHTQHFLLWLFLR
jgi:hypothetical protein